MISSQSLGAKRRTESRPILVTVSTSRPALIPETPALTEALSRDHLNVAVAAGPPECTSTRYSRFSVPRYPPLAERMHGSSLAGTPTALVVSRPAGGAVSASQPGISLAQVVPGRAGKVLTCHTT